jgi:hypothetical protein
VIIVENALSCRSFDFHGLRSYLCRQKVMMSGNSFTKPWRSRTASDTCELLQRYDARTGKGRGATHLLWRLVASANEKPHGMSDGRVSPTKQVRIGGRRCYKVLALLFSWNLLAGAPRVHELDDVFTVCRCDAYYLSGRLRGIEQFSQVTKDYSTHGVFSMTL